MPTPVSSTEICNEILSSLIFSYEMENTTFPFFVYLTAFVRMFVAICFSLITSPKSIRGIDSFIIGSNIRPFASARGWIILTRSLSIDVRSYSAGIISSFPASSFERSRMSFIRSRRVLLARFILCAYDMILSSSHSRSIILFIPMIALIGVLIS